MEHLGQYLLRHHRRDHPEIPPRLAHIDQTRLRYGNSYNQVGLREGKLQERAQGIENKGEQRDRRYERVFQAMCEAVHSLVEQYLAYATPDEGVLEGIQKMA